LMDEVPISMPNKYIKIKLINPNSWGMMLSLKIRNK